MQLRCPRANDDDMSHMQPPVETHAVSGGSYGIPPDTSHGMKPPVATQAAPAEATRAAHHMKGPSDHIQQKAEKRRTQKQRPLEVAIPMTRMAVASCVNEQQEGVGAQAQAEQSTGEPEVV